MRMPEPQIVACGGGGVPDPVLNALAARPVPRVLYVGTANAESAERAVAMYERLRGRAELSHLNFFPWPPADLREFTLGQDVIFVGGGSTANTLAIWRVHGFDRVL